MNPLDAVRDPDPYPYYADLVARGGLIRDGALGIWIAADAASVTRVLQDATLAVRPAAEKIPATLAGSRAGEIFGTFMRMDDSPRHDQTREALESTLPVATPTIVRTTAARFATEAIAAPVDFDGLAFRMPIYTIATLLGIPHDDLADVLTWTRAFVRAAAPGASTTEIAEGSKGGEALFSLFTAQLEDATVRGVLLPKFVQNLEQAGGRQRDAIANAIGLLFQTCDATAGLIGNTIVRLQNDPALLRRLHHEYALLPKTVAEILRWDSPVQNTRRFVTRALKIGTIEVKPGETILAVLAAANRDPLANEHPQTFDPERTTRRTFTFGSGTHACPGERIALTIAEAALRALLESGASITRTYTYQPSVNARIPLFGT